MIRKIHCVRMCIVEGVKQQGKLSLENFDHYFIRKKVMIATLCTTIMNSILDFDKRKFHKHSFKPRFVKRNSIETHK